MYLPSQGILGHGVRDTDACQLLSAREDAYLHLPAAGDARIRGRVPSPGRVEGQGMGNSGGGKHSARRSRGEAGEAGYAGYRRPGISAAREPSAAVKRILDDMAERAAEMKRKATGQQDGKLSAAERMQALRRRIRSKGAAAAARADGDDGVTRDTGAGSSCMSSTGSPPTKEVVKIHQSQEEGIHDDPAGAGRGGDDANCFLPHGDATGSSAEGGIDAAVAAEAARVAWESAGAMNTAGGAAVL